MMKDYFRFAFQSIRHRKVQSLLTVLAIIIGIAAIVSLVTISQGLENAIEEQFKNLGSDKLYVSPKGVGFAFSLESDALTEEDMDVLDGIGEVRYVNGYLYGKTSVLFRNDDTYTGITGLLTEEDPEMVLEGQGFSLSEGRWFKKGETGVAIIGSSLAVDGFDKEIFLNNKLDIGEESYDVIGVLNKLGNEEDDNTVWLHIDDSRTILEEDVGVTFIEVVVHDGIALASVAEEVERVLERHRDAEDFEVFIPEQVLEQLGNILNVVQVVLAGIAGISLLVGGIGIMNSMFTNVLERKKEIGIMKAIGASPKDIRMMFLVEAGIIGAVGGVLGAALGVLVSFSVGEVALAAGFILLHIQVEVPIILFGILFAFVVGMVSGYLPAREAAKLYPVEALRE
jgi:putative ABC transport system permease protein